MKLEMVLQIHQLVGDILKPQNSKEMPGRKRPRMNAPQVAQGPSEGNRELKQNGPCLLSKQVSRGLKLCLPIGREKEEGQDGEKIRNVEWDIREEDLTTEMKSRPSEKAIS